jgi:hypothetical protein
VSVPPVVAVANPRSLWGIGSFKFVFATRAESKS